MPEQTRIVAPCPQPPLCPTRGRPNLGGSIRLGIARARRCGVDPACESGGAYMDRAAEEGAKNVFARCLGAFGANRGHSKGSGERAEYSRLCETSSRRCRPAGTQAGSLRGGFSRGRVGLSRLCTALLCARGSSRRRCHQPRHAGRKRHRGADAANPDRKASRIGGDCLVASCHDGIRQYEDSPRERETPRGPPDACRAIPAAPGEIPIGARRRFGHMPPAESDALTGWENGIQNAETQS